MKKYNRSEIMKRAWELVKKAGTTISEALKKAWKEAKKVKKHFDGYAKVLRVDNNPNVNDETSFYTFKLWEKNGKKRIYANDYKRRAVGYIDLNADNTIITEYSERSGQYKTIQKFVEEYAF